MFYKPPKKIVYQIFAPQTGKTIPITEVPDHIFSDKILGDGVAVISTSSTIVAPVAGKVSNMAETHHAYGIETADGLEVLIYIGIGTMKLNGKGFDNQVKVGDSVEVGSPLCNVNWDLIIQAGCEAYTLVVITTMDVINRLTVEIGDCKAGNSCILRYELN